MAPIVAWCSRLAAVLSVGSTVALASSIIDLSSFQWTLASSSLNITVPAKVPSYVHLDLHAANVINDPYHGLNDYDLRWIITSNWTYSASVSKPDPSSSAWLLFNGLDTFTSINLCGKHVAATNNQFRQYHFDVTNIFKDCPTSHILSINFGSAANIAQQIANQPGQETWPSGVEGLFEYEHRQFVRKEQNDFGWDWGPAFVPAGVWQPAYLLQLAPSDLHVRNSLVDIYRQGQIPLLPPDQGAPWVINASIDVIGTMPKDASLTYQLFDMKENLVSSGKLSNITTGTQTITGATIVPADKVELWWPTGLGDQKLYTIQIAITAGDKSDPVTSVKKRVGFRTILLNQEPIRPDQIAVGTAPGANWHFEVNGKEFYAKGSNFIPPDAFWTRVTKQSMQQLFNAVIKGNQNMLRVWSSGAYLPDFAYDIADELGLLLWSEFQFGDALYPVDKEFLDNVREEANYQVRRLNHHASLALWAGGNELENLELNMVHGDDFAKYQREYEMLFLDVLAVSVFENSKSISYTPSSTSNGWLKLDFSRNQPIIQRYYNVTAGEIYGDTDHYNYDSTSAFNYRSYPVGRFSNEFGYHSMPSIQTWRQAVEEVDLSFESPVVRLRNHHYPPGGLEKNFDRADDGMLEMVTAVKNYYPVPNKKDAIANFTSWCIATQIFQADFYSSQIQFYRRGSGRPERQLGSLYWQLEDIWQAPTWAGIEYGGRWKMLHYIAKDRYENVIISPFYDSESGELEVYVTSDLFSAVNGTASFAWYDWSGKPLQTSLKDSLMVPVQVGALNSTRVAQWNVTEILQGIDMSNAVLKMDTIVQGRRANTQKDEEFSHQNWFHPVPLGKGKLVDPQLKLTHLPSDKKFRIEASKGIASWVWVDYPSGALVTFDSNGFWLKPGEPKEIKYEVHSDDTNGKWAEKTTVQSLWDMTLP